MLFLYIATALALPAYDTKPFGKGEQRIVNLGGVPCRCSLMNDQSIQENSQLKDLALESQIPQLIRLGDQELACHQLKSDRPEIQSVQVQEMPKTC